MKLAVASLISPTLKVAPHVGAWIEINASFTTKTSLDVAPHVGAWIEINWLSSVSAVIDVAPHVGAWIEIFQTQRNCTLATPSLLM